MDNYAQLNNKALTSNGFLAIAVLKVTKMHSLAKKGSTMSTRNNVQHQLSLRTSGKEWKDSIISAPDSPRVSIAELHPRTVHDCLAIMSATKQLLFVPCVTKKNGQMTPNVVSFTDKRDSR